MNPTDDREQARAIRLLFPCGCLDAHQGGGMTVEEYTCETHRTIASALSSRDAEVGKVLDQFKRRNLDGPCWCEGFHPTLPHEERCQATRALYAKLHQQ